jgi:hypothetical protein
MNELAIHSCCSANSSRSNFPDQPLVQNAQTLGEEAVKPRFSPSVIDALHQRRLAMMPQRCRASHNTDTRRLFPSVDFTIGGPDAKEVLRRKFPCR